jgi:hypothetical protein
MDLRWLIDNALNFTPHLVVLALALAAFAIFGPHWPLVALSVVVVVAGNGYMLRSDSLLARAHACGTGDRITIAIFNTRLGRADTEAFIAYLEAQRVDIVVLQELNDNDASRPKVEALKALFSYEGISSTQTLRMLSRTPLGGTVEDYIVAPRRSTFRRRGLPSQHRVASSSTHGARSRSG